MTQEITIEAVKPKDNKAFLFSALFLIWFSLFFAFFFAPFFENSFINLGGEHGAYASDFLEANIGIPGTFFLLLGTGLLFAIFAFSQTVPFLRGLFHRKPKVDVRLALSMGLEFLLPCLTAMLLIDCVYFCYRFLSLLAWNFHRLVCFSRLIL